MKLFNKKSVWTLTVFITFLLCGHLYYYITGDFRTSYLLPSQAFGGFSGLVYPNEIGDVELKEILDQEYIYLGHGNQTYAFVSDDDHYVLKLFKKDFFRRTSWVHVLPPVFPFRAMYLYSGEGKEKRRNKLVNGYATGYLYDRENCGLLYFHPGTERRQEFEATLVTALGTKIAIDLDKYIFAIQVKAVTTKKELSRLLSQGKVSEAKQRIHQLYDLYFAGYSKDLFDHDHNLVENTGFFGDHAIRQDVGKVVKDPDLITYSSLKKDLGKITNDRLGPWLQNHYPQYAPEIIQEMQDRVSTYLQDLPNEN